MSVSSSPSSTAMPFLSQSRLGWKDIKEGVFLWKLAFSLGWLDIKLRYRGSALGPLWLTLTTASMVVSMGFIYSHLFRLSVHDYIPFLAISLVLWQTGIASMVSEACTCFTSAEQTIRSVKLPFFVQALRTLWRNIIVFLHNIIVPLAVFIYVGEWPGLNLLYTLPAFILWCLDGLALCLFLGSVCSRYRDIPPIVNTFLQLAFYVTPIIWTSSQLGTKGWWLPANPFFSLLEIIRAPLLGTPPSWSVWVSAFVFSALLWGIAWFTFKFARARLVFWL